MTYRQYLIKNLAAARKAYKQAKRNDREARKYHACPDDELIYQVYITEERVWCWEAALAVHRQLAKAEGRK